MRVRRFALRRGRRNLFGIAAALFLVVLIQSAPAATTAVIDGAAAAGLCTSCIQERPGRSSSRPVSGT